jgi:hypothetical protein
VVHHLCAAEGKRFWKTDAMHLAAKFSLFFGGEVTVAKEKNRLRVIKQSKCSCPIGKSGYCSHVAFLLIQAAKGKDAITVTDTPAVWKNPNLCWNEFSNPVSSYVPQESSECWASARAFEKFCEIVQSKDHPPVHMHQVNVKQELLGLAGILVTILSSISLSA